MSASSDLSLVTYAIDANDCLLAVDDAWQDFAEENEGGHRLRPENVVGQSLWNFVHETTLQTIYRQLVDAVRSDGGPAEFDFRCDSPRFRRYMRMKMIGREDGVVQFVSATKAIEPRAGGVRLAGTFAGARHVVRCSICNLYRLPNGLWAEITEAIEDSHWLAADQQPRLLWSVCQSCKGRLTLVI